MNNTTYKTKILLGEPTKGEGLWGTVDIGNEADFQADLNEPLTLFREGSLETIGAFHLIEHLRPTRAREAVASWIKALKPGGMLVIECPDFHECILWYVRTGEKLAKEWIFGNDSREGQHHFWGYTKEELLRLLEGLPVDAEFAPPQDYHKNEGPCLRIEITKR